MTRAPARAFAQGAFYLLGSAGLLVAALDWGQKVLIPLALAVLLSFVLAPLVSRLDRGRAASGFFRDGPSGPPASALGVLIRRPARLD
jgi:predicted PurR-regulated permease PerM